MANQNQDPANVVDTTNTSTNTGQDVTNGSGDPSTSKPDDIEKLVKERMAQQEEELRKKILEDIEKEKNLTEAQKLELEKQKLQRERDEWKKQLETETIALNVEKVKSIYNKAGLSEEIVNVLVENIGLDFTKEETKANNLVKAINSFVESKTKELTTQIQKQQPSPTIKSGSQTSENQNSSFFDKFNEGGNQQNQTSFFK